VPEATGNCDCRPSAAFARANQIEGARVADGGRPGLADSGRNDPRGVTEEAMVRWTLGMGSAGLLFAFLGLAVGGCGTIPEGLGHLQPSLVEPSRTSLDGESALADVRPPAAGKMAAAPATEGAAVTATPHEQVAEGAGAAGDGLLTEAAEPAFVPVALESIPPGPSSHLIALADGPKAETSPETPQKPGATEPESDLEEIEEYDPWESFNEKIFTFNYKFDRYVLKPVAKGYNFIMPDLFQQMIGRGFDNIRVVPKLVNNLLQGNWKGFAVELGRFLINSTLGIGGLFDIARQEFGLERTKVDFGQTLGKWGIKPGPFVIVPFLPPLTVRDGIGYGVDSAIDPLGYFIPFFPDKLAMRLGDIINDRALNLELFQGFEETTVDLYSAMRNGYLQRRYNLIHQTP
jgi:phospholipid-binding lipoprotein MlaA